MSRRDEVYGVWESTFEAEKFEDSFEVSVELFVRYEGVRRMSYSLWVHKRDGALRIYPRAIPHGIHVKRLPRGAKQELKRIFPLIRVMVST